MVVFLGSWMIVADFRHSGMKDWDCNAFKISVKALDSWSELSEDPTGRYVWSGCLSGVHCPQCLHCHWSYHLTDNDPNVVKRCCISSMDVAIIFVQWGVKTTSLHNLVEILSYDVQYITVKVMLATNCSKQLIHGYDSFSIDGGYTTVTMMPVQLSTVLSKLIPKLRWFWWV